MAKILILVYSAHGGTYALAEEIAAGVLESGSEYWLRKVPGSQGDCPVVSRQDYQNADGWIVGSPAYFGNMAAPMQAFFDTLGGFWSQGGLQGKPAAVFTSASSLHGGQEAALLAMHIPLLHLGAVIVGIPFYQTGLDKTTSGGTPYGASHWAPLPSTPLSESEKTLARVLGKRVALIAQQLVVRC